MARILATYVKPACHEASERMPVLGVTFELGVEVEVSERVAAKLRCLPYFSVREESDQAQPAKPEAEVVTLPAVPGVFAEPQPEHRAPRRAIAVDVKGLPRRLGRGKV